MLKVVQDADASNENTASSSLLDEIVRDGARQMLATALQAIESAQHRWRAVNSAHLVALVRAGATFENGVLVERPDESTRGDTHTT